MAAVVLASNEPGTDLWAIEHGLVSITPLRLDLADPAASGACSMAP